MSEVVILKDKDESPKAEFDEAKNYDIYRKLTVIGRGECGKTCLVHRYVYNDFRTSIPATPVENRTLNLNVKDKRLGLRIFDTSGQEDYLRFRTLTLPASDYVLICFSVVDQLSLSEVEDTIIPMIKSKAPEKVKIILVATKTDLRNENSINFEEGKMVAENIKALKYFECSSLNGTGIAEIFDFIRLDMYKSVYPDAGLCKSLFSC